MPVLNEAEGMRHILPQLDRSLFDQILVVDGQSTDGSVQCAREMGCEVYVQKKKGIRHAYTEAWPLIRGEVVVTLSPDGNCRIDLLPELLSKIKEGYDMVIASRYLGGITSEDDTPVTRFGNRLFTGLINFLHGSRYTDAMGIYRAYRTRLFYELKLDQDASYFPESWIGTVAGVEPLLSIRAAKHRLKTAEIQAPEPARLAGERKLQVIRWGLVYLYQTLKEKIS